VREEISTEQWQRLNRLFHQIHSPQAESQFVSSINDLLASIIDGIHLFKGVTNSTMIHGQGWQFIRLGRYIERAYATATLRIEKNDRYRYDMTWRRSNFFNSSLDNGESATLRNTSRVMQDHDLTLTATKWAKLKLGYSRNKETGPEFSNYEMYIGGLARDVLPIDRDTRRDWNEYRVGTQLDFLGFRLSLSQSVSFSLHKWRMAKSQELENRSKVTLENLFASLEAAQSKGLKVVVKADAQGSVEAIVEALKKIDSEKISLEIIHSDVGTIT